MTSPFSRSPGDSVPSYLPGKTVTDDLGNHHHHDGSSPSSVFDSWTNHTTSTLLPSLTGLYVRSFVGLTVALYILNQKHLLPLPLSRVVSKALFWPTLPLTYLRRRHEWYSRIDETVLIGAAPFGFAGIPERLYEQQNVRGVINMCEEYKGPTKHYAKLGIQELHLPTPDHFEPSLHDLQRAVQFIQHYQQQGESVYVHCRAGHGRSAAAVFCYLLTQDPNASRKELNEHFGKVRSVRKSLWKQPNIIQFHNQLHDDTKDTSDDGQ